MRNDIYCLMTSGVSLTRNMANLLFDTACLMIREGKGRKAVKDSEIEGEVRTDFTERVLSSVGGVEFYATVETELGNGSVKFLVRPADVEIRNKLAWTPFFSVEDLMDELTSPPSRRAPTYN